MAGALGRVMSLASDKAAGRVLTALGDAYINEAQNDDKLEVVSLCFSQIARYAPQHLRKHVHCAFAALLLGPFDAIDSVKNNMASTLTEMGWTSKSLCNDENDTNEKQKGKKYSTFLKFI